MSEVTYGYQAMMTRGKDKIYGYGPSMDAALRAAQERATQRTGLPELYGWVVWVRDTFHIGGELIGFMEHRRAGDDPAKGFRTFAPVRSGDPEGILLGYDATHAEAEARVLAAYRNRSKSGGPGLLTLSEAAKELARQLGDTDHESVQECREALQALIHLGHLANDGPDLDTIRVSRTNLDQIKKKMRELFG